MTRTKLAIRLGLGILCGLALILVPLVFSTTTSNSAITPRTATTNTTNPDYFVTGVQHANFTAGPSSVPLSGVTLSLGSLSILMIILFIFVPSVVFSLVIRKWAEKRARDYI